MLRIAAHGVIPRVLGAIDSRGFRNRARSFTKCFFFFLPDRAMLIGHEPKAALRDALHLLSLHKGASAHPVTKAVGPEWLANG
jgi:hypothetical protein